MRRSALWMVVAALVWVGGCGGGSTSTPASTVSVIVSPAATQTVFQGGTVTYTATVNSTVTSTGVVTDITSTGVTWQVDGTTGGSADTGVISASGVYTAPNPVNVSFVVTITAVSVQDTTASTSATLDVNALPDVIIAPTTATVGAGQTQTFVPTYSAGVSMPDQAVFWYVNNTLGGNSTTGTISPAGVYTAPQVPPVPGGGVTVTAVLQSDSTQISSAAVTDTYATASLNSLACSYAFLIRGQTTKGAFLRAGTFTANGQGGLTGIEDINGGGVTATAVAFTGSYTVSADGRGTMIFQDNYGNNFGGGNSNFSLVIVSAGQMQLAETDTFATGSGEADLQSSCSQPAAALSGGYVFDFSGTDESANPLSIVGEFDAGGAGVEDFNDNGTLVSNATISFASVLGGANGRSTATFTRGATNTQFAFYTVSASRLLFIELDSAPVVGGEADAQAAPGGGFNMGSIGGSILVTTRGTSSSGPAVIVASSSASIVASIGTLASGTLVANNAGSVTTGTPFTGTYAVTNAASGRGTMSLSGGQTYVFYLSGLGQGVIQETDSTIVGDGLLASSTTSPPALSSLSSNFALQWSGAGTSVGEQDATGQFVALSGNFESGTLDSNTANGANPARGFTPIVNNSLTPGSAYLLRVSPGTITIAVPNPGGSATNLEFAVFFTTQTSAVLVRVDTSDARALSGLLVKQF